MDQEDAVFSALADRTRRQMLDRLFDTPGMTLNDLVANLGMARQSASRHLKVLEAAGLVVVQWQGREKKHFLNPVPIVEIERRWTAKFSQIRSDALLEMKERLESGEGP